MKTLIISCSPRVGGNCDLLADWASKTLPEAEIVYTRDFTCLPCDGCGSCGTVGSCKYTDDGCAAFYKKFVAAKKSVWIAPAYFSGFDAHTKALIDRAQVFFNCPKRRIRARMGLVAVGGQNTADNFDGMRITCKNFGATVGAKLTDFSTFCADNPGEIDTPQNRVLFTEWIRNFEDRETEL